MRRNLMRRYRSGIRHMILTGSLTCAKIKKGCFRKTVSFHLNKNPWERQTRLTHISRNKIYNINYGILPGASYSKQPISALKALPFMSGPPQWLSSIALFITNNALDTCENIFLMKTILLEYQLVASHSEVNLSICISWSLIWITFACYVSTPTTRRVNSVIWRTSNENLLVIKFN